MDEQKHQYYEMEKFWEITLGWYCKYKPQFIENKENTNQSIWDLDKAAPTGKFMPVHGSYYWTGKERVSETKWRVQLKKNEKENHKVNLRE